MKLRAYSWIAYAPLLVMLAVAPSFAADITAERNPHKRRSLRDASCPRRRARAGQHDVDAARWRVGGVRNFRLRTASHVVLCFHEFLS